MHKCDNEEAGDVIKETVKQMLEKKDIKFFEVEDVIKFDVEGERGSWQAFMRVVEEEKLLVIYSLISYKVNPEKIQEVALLLTDINFGLKIGNFEMDRSSGEIHFKTYLDLAGDEAGEDWIERSLFMNIHTTDHYLPQILKATLSA